MNTIDKLKVLEGLGLKQLKEKLIRQPRARMWDAIRKNPEDFTLRQVANAAQMNMDAARDYMTGLLNAGFCAKTYEVPAVNNGVSISPEAMQKVHHYKLVRDVGNEAPQVNRTGKPVRSAAGQEGMWRSLRICGTTSARLLAANASAGAIKVSEESANTYLKFLYRAGYLILVRKSSPGIQAQYRLDPLKNTGPMPPQIQKTKQVFDANIGEVVYQEKPELAAELRDGALDENDISKQETTAEGSQS